MTPMKSTSITKFAGIDNRTPPDRFSRTDDGGMPVRDAVNVDLSPAGTFQRRAGTTQVLAVAGARALRKYAGEAYFAAGDQLYRFDGSTSTAVATLASAIAPVCYTVVPLGLVWSDSISMGLITKGVSAPLAVPAPNPTPSVSAQTGGGLAEGTYAVCFASKDALGRRSALSDPSFVEVGASGIIRISTPPLPHPADVFVSAVNGDVLYREATMSAGAVQLDLSILYADGEAVTYEPQAPLPAGTKLAFHDGRLLSARGPMLAFTKPFELSTYRPHRDYILLESDITLIAPTEEGLFLATLGATYFLRGEFGQATLKQVANFGATPGTLSEVPNSTDLIWFSPRGQVRAGAGGSIELLQDTQIAFPASTSGASIYRESEGGRTLITALQSKPRTSAARMGVYMDAQIIKP